ncbi:MAG: PPOX class F420-dependent oxidoreductase [Rhodospirillales bacterium]|nr:PPOX class F420-dependent oxidoreductase [Rhodospirillales bacterium]
MDPLAGEKYVSRATFRKTGKAVETPVWSVAMDGRYYIYSGARTGKVKRLRNSPRARIATCGSRGQIHGAWLDAEAVIVDDGDVERRAYAALSKKYGWRMRFMNHAPCFTGRIHRRALFEIRLASAAAPTG